MTANLTAIAPLIAKLAHSKPLFQAAIRGFNAISVPVPPLECGRRQTRPAIGDPLLYKIVANTRPELPGFDWAIIQEGR
ncbi:MAG: hypothetical protein LBO66_00075 [Deltaproteobacteria bacterium]|nr:hypothetical protein [Deltaproteobacteria bacterium]